MQAMASTNPLSLSLSLPFLFLLVFLIVEAADVRKLNAVDRCWRNDPNWADHRERLAFCSVGFCGKMKKNRGKSLTFYQVTDSSDSTQNPRNGTLRFGALMIPGKVWITFKEDMTINLKGPLLVNNRTAIDGRGANVHIAYGAGFLLYEVSNVIIHGLHFHDIYQQDAVRIRKANGKVLPLTGIDGDAIRLVKAYKVWIDHNTFYRGTDGLVDVTLASTRITISNNRFSDHNKVLLLGHSDDYIQDRDMRVTIAFNHFGPNCNQRMPRIRHGYTHLVNNVYDGWSEYAVGGGMNPTIMSQANYYIAPAKNKAIIWENSGTSWNLKSVDDIFVNGALFREEGMKSVIPRYGPWQKFLVGSKEEVLLITKDAGALQCRLGRIC